jgi:uncharacterized protein (TIGR00255 family)
MALQSMTGFGAAHGRLGTWQLSFEVKAVNHKALDVRFHTRSPEWSAAEPLVHQAVRSRVRRGHLTVSLHVTPWARVAEGGAQDRPLELDEAAFVAVYKQLRMLVVRYGLRTDLSISDMMMFSHVFMGSASGQLPEDMTPVVAILDRALDQLMANRDREGQALHALFTAQLARLSDLVEQAAALRPTLLDGYRERVRERVQEVIQQVGAGVLDEQRLVAEVALFAERTDIAEELQRAGSHIARLGALLTSQEPVGKQLDFYLQEMIRETNTMASKSNFSALTDLIIQMKSIVEQLREQAANIE